MKLVRYMGIALTGMIYIFDEPSTGIHPRDVHRMCKLLRSLRYKGNTVLVVEQSTITATGRSTPATFLGFFHDVRKVMFKENGHEVSMFSFNSKGGCPVCKGKGLVVTELIFMDPITTVCEEYEGSRYNKEALSYKYRGKNIMEILDMSAEDDLIFFKYQKKIAKLKNL